MSPVLASPLMQLACISLQNSLLSGWVHLGYLILLQQTLSIVYGFLASLSLVEVDLKASYSLVSRTPHSFLSIVFLAHLESAHFLLRAAPR